MSPALLRTRFTGSAADIPQSLCYDTHGPRSCLKDLHSHGKDDIQAIYRAGLSTISCQLEIWDFRAAAANALAPDEAEARHASAEISAAYNAVSVVLRRCTWHPTRMFPYGVRDKLEISSKSPALLHIGVVRPWGRLALRSLLYLAQYLL